MLSKAQQERREFVKKFTEELRGKEWLLFFDFTGLKVADFADLRYRVKEKGATNTRVVKNTLLRFTLRSLGYEGFDEILEGPTAVVYGDGDIVEVAKVIKEYIEEVKSVKFKGSIVSGKFFGAEQTEQLATLPSRSELVARVVGGVSAPLYGLVWTLSGLLRGLVVALDQIREKKAS